MIVGITLVLLPMSLTPLAFAAPVLPAAPAAPTYDVATPAVPAAPSSPTLQTSETVTQTTTETTTTTTEITQPQASVTETPAVEVTTVETSSTNQPASATTSGSDLLSSGNVSNSDINTSGSTETANNSDGNSDGGSGNTTSISNHNDANVNNSVNLDADSGNNTANYNTGNGSVSSGNANIVLSVLNFINTVFIAPNGGQISLLFDQIIGNLVGDYIIDPDTGEAYSQTGSRLDIGNSNTGAGSSNNAFVNLGSSTRIDNDNDGVLDNDINLSANTGGNQANYNTGNGSVSSGDANISLNLLNFLNSTFLATGNGLLGILSIFGNFDGNLVIPSTLLASSSASTTFPLNVEISNENTGADSVNNATATIDNSLDIDNDNNADISNDLEISGTSGNNDSSYNTGSGSVDSGNVDVNVAVGNTANQNIIGDSIFYIIINVLGNWSGSNLLASLLGATVIPNAAGDGETIVLQNLNTGANSENNATLVASNSTEISNNNDATIDNNILISANTGNNSASYNTGNGSVSSGDVNVLANILNLANINVVAHKFVFFVINIFGDWNGDVSDHGSDDEENNNGGNNGGNSGGSSSTTTGNSATTVNTSARISGNGFVSLTSNTSVSATGEDTTSQVLAANTGIPTSFTNDTDSDDGANSFLNFLDNNLWKILIILGSLLLATSIYAYARQRRVEEVS